ncbi:MAG: glycosyltransferase [Pseudomonas sp. CO183]|nr:MAG: glycosyltransferase [Pseudomonas sp. CO183]
MRFRFLAGGLLLALCGNVMAAQVYKWVDAQGVTHFGAQPPQGQQVETVNTVTAPAKPAATPQPVEQDEAEADQSSIDRKVKQQVAAQEAERKRYCETMRTNLAQLQNNPRVRVEDNGETRRLTEEERQSRINETRDKIAENCN